MPNFDMVLDGLLIAGGGALGVKYAYHIARFSEQIDSIGSKTAWDAVEPAGWKVGMTRVASAFVIVLGAVAVFAGLFG